MRRGSYSEFHSLSNYTVNFVQNTHRRYVIARPHGRAMRCLLRVGIIISVLSLHLTCCIQYLITLLKGDWTALCKHGHLGGHYWNYYTGALSSHLSYFNSLDDGVPVEWTPRPQDWCPIILFKSLQLISRWGASRWICWYPIFTKYQEPEQDDRVPVL